MRQKESHSRDTGRREHWRCGAQVARNRLEVKVELLPERVSSLVDPVAKVLSDSSEECQAFLAVPLK
jgi:hypothetical protein